MSDSMKRYSDTIDAPAHWAPYLINDDASGMTDEEQAECDAWHKSISPNYSIVDCSEENFFGRFYFPVQNKMLGCDLVTYGCLYVGPMTGETPPGV